MRKAVSFVVGLGIFLAVVLALVPSRQRQDKELEIAKARHARTISYLEECLMVDPDMAKEGRLSTQVLNFVHIYERALRLLETQPLDSFFEPVPIAASRYVKDAEGKTLIFGLCWLEREFRVNGFYLVTAEGERLEYPHSIDWEQEYKDFEYGMWWQGRLIYVYTESRDDLVKRFGEHMGKDYVQQTIIHVPLDTALGVSRAGLIDRDGNLLPIDVFHAYEWEPEDSES